MSDRAKSWFARWKMGQNLKNSYLPHRGELRPHIWGGEPWPTYLQNDPKLERFRDFGTPNLSTPTTITSVKNIEYYRRYFFLLMIKLKSVKRCELASDNDERKVWLEGT